MATKISILVGILAMAMSTLSFAGYYNSYGSDDQKKGNGSSYGNKDQNQGYESSFGNKYQYDLNNPSDRVDYDTDPDAQVRDKFGANPGREFEKGVGENFGGVYQ